ncbi:MAG TPA: protein kinase [Anaerolineales bacterium]|nr:protein kinase [Anaerolineales bacterium]HLO31538.1 protein kinase [Anaerolineales bacterium]
MEDRAKSIDDYQITETALKSAEGIIYRAVEKSSGTKVFLKKYYPSLDWSEEVLNEFFNLFSYLRFIEHEYLLPILDVGKDEGRPYVVFADNSFTLLCERPPGQASQPEVLKFLHAAAEALDFLHKQEIIHGGLCPGNVVLDPDGYPLLFDFGLYEVFKRLLLENMDDGFENLSVASLQCTSPEQIIGRNPTRASDIYTFGLLGYYYIFCELPFNRPYIPEIAISHLTNGIIQTLELPAGLSREVLPFIQKCIQVKPEARFEGFPQILNSLERMQSGKSVRLKFEKRFAMLRPLRPARLSPAFAGAAVLAVSLLVFSYLYIRSRAASASPALTATTTAPASAVPATRTHTADAQTPAQPGTAETSTPSSPVATAYELAFEGQKPVDLQQPISIANLASLREISRLGYGKPEQAAVAPDNNQIAIATSGGVVMFTGNQFLKWIDPQGWATSVEFSPDSTTLAIGLKSGEIQLWDWQNATRSATLTGHTKQINRILFAPNGLLYSASADQHIIAWNLKSNKSLQDITAHSKGVNDIAVTSDARLLVSCSDDRLIRVWDLASGKKLYELGSQYFTGAIRAVAISSDDAYFAAGGEAGFLYQWNLITAAPSSNANLRLRTDIVPVQERIWSLQYTRDNQELLVGVDAGKTVTYEAPRQGYGGLSSSFKIPLPPLRLVDVFGSAFDFDSFSVSGGNEVVSINWDGQVTNQQGQLISPMYDILDRLDFSPDGTVLAAGGRRGSTHVWDLRTNQPLYKNLYFLPFGDPIAPDGKSIALIVPKTIPRSSGKELIEDIYQIKELSGSQSTRDLAQTIPDANVGYTSDGTIFIAANLKKSRAWEYTNGNETHLAGYAYTGCWITTSANNNKDRLQVDSAAGTFPGGDDEHIDNLCPKTYQFRGSLPAFSNDLNLMVYINSNGALEGYDVLRKTSPWPPYQIQSPTKVTVLAISPDGSLIAIGSATGKILFINGKTGEFIDELVGNFGTVLSIEFSEDGKKIATAGEDGVVRVFGILENR